MIMSDSKRINIRIKDPKFRKNLSLDKQSLKKRYEIMYNETFKTSPPGSSAHLINQSKSFLKNKTVLDLGCGSGRVSLYASKYAKKVLGIDYIEDAIKFSNKFASICNIKNVEFQVGDLDKFSERKVDVIIMAEVLQHVDNPNQVLRRSNKILNKNGRMIISVPSFNNFRGIIWQSLQNLLGVPMSLTDTFYITAEDMEKMVRVNGFKIEKIISTAWDWAWTEWAIDDMKRRVKLAFKDAKLEKVTNFKNFERWLESNLEFNKQFVNYLIKNKIIKKRKATNLLKIPRNVDKKTREYLDDGNTKVNLYYSDVPPFNRMGEGTIYILKKIE